MVMGNKTNPVKIFAGRATRSLAEKICDSLDLDLGQSSCPIFSDGEFEPCFEETIRGSHVFILQSTMPPADNLMELLLMIDAAKRASAKRITRYGYQVWGGGVLAGNAPKSWTFEGWNGSSWVVLHTVSNYPIVDCGVSLAWSFTNNNSYTKYRINVTSNQGREDLYIAEIRMYAPTYTLSAYSGDNGSISDEGDTVVNTNTDKTYTITPDSGYEVDDVLVDEVSVGAVEEYTFEDITADHTIHVTFKAESTPVEEEEESTKTAIAVIGELVPVSSMLYIFDSDLNRLGLLENYEYLRWTFRYRKVDDFEIHINRHKLEAFTPVDEDYNGFAFREKLTFANSEFETFTDFPVLVIVDNTDGKYVGLSDYDKIDFRDANGSQLAWECAGFKEGGKGYYYVKVPIIRANDAEHIYMYWGSNTSTEDKTGVWDSNYKAVYHMRDDKPSTILDSTSNDNDGVKKGAYEPAEAWGDIGKCQDFDGSDDYINCGNDASLWSTGSFTFSALINPSAFNDYNMVMGQGPSIWRRFFWVGTTGFLRAFSQSLSEIPLDEWSLITAKFENDTWSLYINGEEVSYSMQQTGDGTPTDYSSENFAIGATNNGSYPFTGKIAQIAVYNGLLSDNYLKAQDKILRQQDYVTFGGVESYNPKPKPDMSGHLDKGNIIALYVGGQYRGGIIEDREIQLTEKGKISEVWKIKGRGLGGLMSERIALHNTDSGTGYDSQDTYAETAMKYYVNKNCIDADDTDRNYSNLILQEDYERGGNLKYDARFQYLDELLEELCLVSGLGWGIVLDVDNKNLIFQVYEGLDRSYGNTDGNTSVTFSPEFGNIRIINYKSSRKGYKTVYYVAGQGEANARTVQEVKKDGATYNDMDRLEGFADGRNLDSTDKLTQKGDEILAEKGVKETVEMENLSGGPFDFGVDFTMGDIVTVRYPDIVEADARVLESKLVITPEQGIQNKLILGREYPDLKIRNIMRDAYPEIRK